MERNAAPAQNQMNLRCRRLKGESFFRNDWSTAQNATRTTRTPAYSPPPVNRQAEPGARGGSPWAPAAAHLSYASSTIRIRPTAPQYAPPSSEFAKYATSRGV